MPPTHRAPHHIAAYLTELASCFHNFLWPMPFSLVDDAETDAGPFDFGQKQLLLCLRRLGFAGSFCSGKDVGEQFPVYLPKNSGEYWL